MSLSSSFQFFKNLYYSLKLVVDINKLPVKLVYTVPPFDEYIFDNWQGFGTKILPLLGCCDIRDFYVIKTHKW